ALARRRLASAPLAGVWLVERRGERWVVVPGAGAGAPPQLLDELLLGGSTMRLAAAGKPGESLAVAVHRDDGSFRLAYGASVDGGGRRAIFAELDVEAMI